MAKPKKLKNGKYEIRVKVKNIFTGEWENKKKRFDTVKECKEWENNIKLKAFNGISSRNIRLIDFFDLWFETFKKNSVGPDHQNKIKSVRKSIVEYFNENILLTDINKIKYQSWINYLGTTKNQAYATVKDKHSIFKEMMNEAVDMDYLIKNPCNKIVLVGRDTSKERKVTLSMAEWQKLIDVILNSKEDCPSKWVSLTMLYTGLRFQEATGLQTTDIDLNKQVIYVTEAYDYKRKKIRSDTKTVASIREVDMVDELVEILRPVIVKARSHDKVVEINKKERGVYLFVNEDTELPITNAALNKYIQKKCKIAGIDKVTSHAFRHAQTDILALVGADMIYTQKQLGHADPHTTLKYYSSITPEIREKNKNSRNNFLRQNKI